MFGQSFVELARAGGGTIFFILLCSVLVVGLAIERTVVLWGYLPRARALAETVKRCLYRGAVPEARAACERSNSGVAEIFLIGFERHGRSDARSLEAAVERERQRVAISLKGPLWMVGTIGALAPFIGLFGTVVGIMRAFNQIGVQKRAGIEVVGPGIAEALVTTAIGIGVGIAAVMVYNYFQQRLAGIALELRLMGEEFAEVLAEQKPGPAARDASGSEATVAPAVA